MTTREHSPQPPSTLDQAADGGQIGIDQFNEALSARQPYAVVITDLRMPYVDGRQVASAVKQAYPVTPVVMLTGWGQRMADQGEIPPHVARVLRRPPKLLELNAALVQCLTPERRGHCRCSCCQGAPGPCPRRPSRCQPRLGTVFATAAPS